jgi:hypothetical protein
VRQGVLKLQSCLEQIANDPKKLNFLLNFAMLALPVVKSTVKKTSVLMLEDCTGGEPRGGQHPDSLASDSKLQEKDDFTAAGIGLLNRLRNSLLSQNLIMVDCTKLVAAAMPKNNIYTTTLRFE